MKDWDMGEMRNHVGTCSAPKIFMGGLKKEKTIPQIPSRSPDQGHNNTISMDKENFNQLIEIKKDLKIEIFNNQNNLILTNLNNSENELLTAVLFTYQNENNEYLLDPEQFQQMIEQNEPKLK
ncbi:40918_t:CDS:2 [Gigaspora margarita]|uniref:40918_t:CDS:1 n=1 Tax=Gigaspora margarita TaxID=4874 RepID=A0ABN7UP97_GIGMA|nr:40918_t:CDS:2 [Gigaspora margarita]